MRNNAGGVRSAKLFLPAILAMAFWATNFVFSIPAIHALGAIQLTGARWVISLVLLVPLALTMERADWSVVRSEWKLHLLQSVLGYVAYTLLLYTALGQSSPVAAAVLVALNPATIAIAARIFQGEHLSTRAIVGIAISFTGAVIVVLAGSQSGALSIGYGDVLILIATLLWTTYSLLAPRVKTPPITATAVQAAMSGAVMIPFMALDIALGKSAWGSLDTNLWIGVLWIGLVPSAGAYFLWNISSQWIGPTRSGAFLNLIPVFTAVFVVMLGGTIGVWHLVGGTIVLLGVSLANRGKSAGEKALA